MQIYITMKTKTKRNLLSTQENKKRKMAFTCSFYVKNLRLLNYLKRKLIKIFPEKCLVLFFYTYTYFFVIKTHYQSL